VTEGHDVAVHLLFMQRAEEAYFICRINNHTLETSENFEGKSRKGTFHFAIQGVLKTTMMNLSS
jgi:hypothetical protein